MSSILLVSGTPAAGKSYFGRWLEAHSPFVHFDVEKDDRLKRNGLKPAWANIFATGNPSAFIHSLNSLGKPIMLNWGFPPDCVEIVAAFKKAGVSLWWFQADSVQARKAFIERDDGSVQAFEHQIKKITQTWSTIEKLYERRIIITLGSDGKRLAPEKIWKQMQSETA